MTERSHKRFRLFPLRRPATVAVALFFAASGLACDDDDVTRDSGFTGGDGPGALVDGPGTVSDGPAATFDGPLVVAGDAAVAYPEGGGPTGDTGVTADGKPHDSAAGLDAKPHDSAVKPDGLVKPHDGGGGKPDGWVKPHDGSP